MTIDIVVITDAESMSPSRVYRDLAPNFQEQVRSVVVLSRSSGLTGSYRNDEAGVWTDLGGAR